MKPRLFLILVLLTLSSCGKQGSTNVPAPAAFDPEATAHFCGMAVGEHPGPKGQIWVAEAKQPIWFASVRDAIAFTLLPEEPKDVRAIYVTDMANAASWDHAAQGNWIEARLAVFVLGADIAGGMGAGEAVPFSDRSAADLFARQHGGHVVAYNEISSQDILGTDTASSNQPAGR